MIERLVLPYRTMPIEHFINRVGGSSFDEPHNLRQAHQPSLLIPQRGEQQVRVSGHHHHSVQINRDGMLPQTALEDQLPRLRGKLPSFERSESHENRTIIFEQVRQSPPVGVLTIKIHPYSVT